MRARWWAFGLWAAVAASALYWGLRLFVPGTPAPAYTRVAAGTTSPRGDLARLFGAEAAASVAVAAPPSSRFQLVGVVAPRGVAAAHQGVALIAVDGKPARAYRIGSVVDGQLVLQSVQTRGAALGPKSGIASVSLELPLPVPAATGTLPGAGAGPAAAVARPPAPTFPVPQPRPSPGFVPGIQRPAPQPAANDAAGQPVRPGPVPRPDSQTD